MIATSRTDAYQQMCARMRDVLASSAVVTLVGYAPELRYEDINYTKEPDPSKYWCRFTIIDSGEKRRTLGKPTRVTYHGLADVQLFIPVSDRSAAGTGSKLADLLQTAYASRTASVDFFVPSVKPQQREDKWYYKRVSAEYNYDVYQ